MNMLGKRKKSLLAYLLLNMYFTLKRNPIKGAADEKEFEILQKRLDNTDCWNDVVRHLFCGPQTGR